MENLVSILVPCYNCEKFLENCLNSLINQSYKNLEIVCVNDGSIDNTLEILNNFALKDKRIKVFNKENEKSISKTRNFLLEKANGKYLTWVDSDDWVEKNYILDMVNAMENKNVDLVICGYQKDKKINAKQKIQSKKIYTLNNIDAIKEIATGKLFQGFVCTKLYKTNMIKSFSFSDNISYGEDLLFNYEYLKTIGLVYYFNNSNYHYVFNKKSITKQKFNTSKLTLLDANNYLINDSSTLDFNINKNFKGMLAVNSLGTLIDIKLSKYKDKTLKKQLKNNIKQNKKYVINNKYFSKFHRFILLISPLFLWLL